jgi:hypothetical protein
MSIPPLEPSGDQHRIYLDANILFSAARLDGAIRKVFRLGIDRGYAYVADAYVVAEARRNLSRKASADSLQSFESLLQQIDVVEAQRCDPDAEIAAWLPAKDRPVLLAAIALRCELLVTGDRDFEAGYGQRFDGVKVVNAQQWAEHMLTRRKPPEQHS